MSRALVVLRSVADRQRAAKWCQTAPYGTRVEFRETKRSLPQNARYWAMLTDIAAQKEHAGRKYSPDIWKAIFLQSWGKEVQFIPSLSGAGVIPLPMSSSDLSKNEMSEMMEFMSAWCAENSVTLHEPVIGEAVAA